MKHITSLSATKVLSIGGTVASILLLVVIWLEVTQ